MRIYAGGPARIGLVVLVAFSGMLAILLATRPAMMRGNAPQPDGPVTLMQTDPMIDRLVGDLKPVRPRKIHADVLMLVVLFVADLGLFVGLGSIRPGLPDAMEQPSFWWKLSSTGVIALAGAAVALLSFDPVKSARPGLRWIAGIVAASLLAGWAIGASPDGWHNLPARLDWRDGLDCVFKVVVLSVPAVIGHGLLMRRGAPTDLGASALSAGIGSAGWGAFIFVFACPYDDPLYITVWYFVGCGITTLVARLILPWLARW